MVELAISISVTGTILLAAAAITQTSVASNAGIGTSSGLSVRTCEAANAVAKLLTNAGLLGEDANANGLLDAGEDTNRNGRLDADWSLANGASDSTLTFNTMLNSANGYVWSDPITLSVVNGVLRSTQGTTVREIARNVDSITFTRNGDLIDVALALSTKDRTGRSWTATARRRVNVRN